MKLSKGQGISLFTAIVTFGIFNTVVFLAPLTHSVNFWLGYFFELFALSTSVSFSKFQDFFMTFMRCYACFYSWHFNSSLVLFLMRTEAFLRYVSYLRWKP